MNVNVIIQARTTSRRLPGKVLRGIDGRPLLSYVIERCLMAESAGSVIVATTTTDFERILPIVTEYGGRLFAFGRYKMASNVAKRFALCLQEFPCDIFVRICADSPLVDPWIIDHCVELLQERGNAWFTSDSVPDGFNVQACKTDFFLKSLESLNESEKEHVLSHIIASRFQPPGISPWNGRLKPKFTVDTPADLEFMRKFIPLMDDHRKFGYMECLALWQSLNA